MLTTGSGATRRMAAVPVALILTLVTGLMMMLTTGLTMGLAVEGRARAATPTDRDRLEIIVQPREPRPDVFVLKGRVRPEYAERKAILQRRNCGSCVWFAVDTFRTDAESRFKVRVPTPDLAHPRKVCYRVKVPRSGRYQRAVSASHCVAPISS